ncbi:Crp/Fnr family transcriptional regulator [Massilia sp. HP4]|uniref:Crp/Fnr family transcriptional regulator n=1 Tax=Massilia sp. HP4 TaxID=2562316 RepID=UPI0010C10E89|nr:Crp/Fnr family transcriptional regulator [Massilia sp. HP4]
MTTIANHAERNIIRLQLKQNVVLKELRDSEMAALEPYLTIENHQKGDLLMNQGVQEMSQYFILDGILKRQVSNQEAKEMILRFSAERDIETSYAAWCLKMPTPFSIACVTKVRVARMPLPQWVDYMRSHSTVKQAFEYEVMNLMSAIMAHTITLHLLDAPGRVHRFVRKHPDLFERLPKKELAAYLNLSPETLSRLKNRGKI